MQLGSAAIFCETFDAKNPGIPSRTGDLDPNVWGVSRASGSSKWKTVTAQACTGLTAPTTHDVIICNGQLREATNDNGDVIVLAMYPKQPFDFAGRTGTVAFDVSNDTQGGHAAWPEFWITDTPVPTPFSHFNSWISFPANALGIRFAANGEIGVGGICPNSTPQSVTTRRFTVDSAIVVRNYNYEDVAWNGVQFAHPLGSTGMKTTVNDCVIMSPGPNGPLNHMEIRVAQNLIEVWASDAGSTALRKIATITNPNLSFSRGLVWLQDAHYNAHKGACDSSEGSLPGSGIPCQTNHTFTWDNVAFDGPFTFRDFSYDALDNSLTPDANGLMDIAKTVPPNQMTTWNVLNMPANPQAAAVRVLFNWRTDNANPVPNNIFVRVNGHAHTIPYPYPANDTLGADGTSFAVGGWRTYPLTIPITELVPGTNVVEIGTDVQTANTLVSNVNIVLVDVPGGVPVLPGSNNAYPASGTSGGSSQ
jgi:hypothetical protein